MTLAVLRSIPDARRDLDVREYEAITAARDNSATWWDIAAALGLKYPQAAAQRYQRLGRKRADSLRQRSASAGTSGSS